MIYLDNAATSWPKAPGVVEAMSDFLTHVGANPGRAGHRLAAQAGRILYDTREALAELFHADDPLRIVFTQNVTEALNLALRGLLRPGDHVITSSMEHNAMMRPLRALERQGVALSVVPCSRGGWLDPQAVETAIRPQTVLIALNHASNVIGTILPVAEVGRIARAHGLLYLVDTAQTAGSLPLDMAAMQIDLLAFTGHKGLGGPPGTGGLILGERVDPLRLDPLARGGTGSNSEREEQPDFLPDRYESGTLNMAGLAGLGAAVRWTLAQGVETIRAHELALLVRLREGLAAIPGVTLFGPVEVCQQVAVVSFTLRGQDLAVLGQRLDEEHEIMCRAGLHCAPAAHRTIGTFPQGTVRFGLGWHNTEEEMAAAARAVAALR
jgi:cysteine desulfurase family protein